MFYSISIGSEMSIYLIKAIINYESHFTSSTIKILKSIQDSHITPSLSNDCAKVNPKSSPNHSLKTLPTNLLVLLL